MIDVVHVTSRLFGDNGVWGGGERYAFELAAHMASLARTRLVSFGPGARRARYGDLEIRVVPIRAQYRSRGNPLSERLPFRLIDARVVHAHQPRTLIGTSCLALGSVLRKPVFVTDLGERQPLPRGARRLERLAGGHLALSEFAREISPQYADRTAVVYAGVDVNRFFPDAGTRERQVVYVGRLLPHKGVDVLLRAMPDNVPLLIFGRAYDSHYHQVLRELANGKRVTFHTSASDGEIAEALRRSRVAVMPSVYRSEFGPTVRAPELFGLAAAEAMASGTPVVCTAVASLPEVVQDGRTGFVVPPNTVEPLRQRIEELLDESPVWRSMSSEAVELIRERFTWPRVARACLHAYEDLSRA